MLLRDCARRAAAPLAAPAPAACSSATNRTGERRFWFWHRGCAYGQPAVLATGPWPGRRGLAASCLPVDGCDGHAAVGAEACSMAGACLECKVRGWLSGLLVQLPIAPLPLPRTAKKTNTLKHNPN